MLLVQEGFASPVVLKICYVFYSKTFIGLAVPVGCRIHAERIPVCGVRKRCNVTLLRVEIRLPRRLSLKKKPFLVVWSWHPAEISWLKNMGI